MKVVDFVEILIGLGTYPSNKIQQRLGVRLEVELEMGLLGREIYVPINESSMYISIQTENIVFFF